MTLIKKMVTDNWTNSWNSGSEETTNPSLQQVIESIRGLDGAVRTQVLVEADGSVLAIGGGNEGRFSVQIIVGRDEMFYTLVDPAKRSDQDVKIVTGGQAGLFPENQAVGINSVIESAREFFVSGNPSPSLKWQAD